MPTPSRRTTEAWMLNTSVQVVAMSWFEHFRIIQTDRRENAVRCNFSVCLRQSALADSVLSANSCALPGCHRMNFEFEARCCWSRRSSRSTWEACQVFGQTIGWRCSPAEMELACEWVLIS